MQVQSRADQISTAQAGGRYFWLIGVAQVTKWRWPQSSFCKGLYKHVKAAMLKIFLKNTADYNQFRNLHVTENAR